ncbi:hypothetical protein GWI33_017871 [Rhynchophorus ferrugineus]|uniref:Lipid-binding serum glycoprotein N-terminal domain-containing protein n=1 Tax=Rhynchophorus ferrugineus TaxID=354439 RepID=A0A834HYH7_RHYFE|nr:hypothetical protein GWI33_017871 [Rhynchophorus ferrugineus]
MSRLILLLFFSTFPFLTLTDGLNRVIEGLIKMAIVSSNDSINSKKNLTILEEQEINLNDIGLDFFAGTLKIPDVTVVGLENLNYVNDMNVSIDDDTNILTLELNAVMLPASGLVIQSYEADMGLFNSIPIYGSGDIKFLIKNVAVPILVTFDITNLKVNTLTIVPELRANEISINGFWNNPELSLVLSETLSALEQLAIMFYNSEIDCISCVLSTLIKTAINNAIHPEDQSLSISQYLSMAESECQATCSLSKSAALRGMFQGNNGVKLSEYKEEHFKSIAEELTRSLVEYVSKNMVDKL